MRLAFALLAVSVTVLPAYAQRDVQQPKGTWQQPKDFQVPKGPWQEPGNIQIPKGINAVRTTTKKTAKSCESRLSVVGDALFDFNKPDLRPDAEETLSAAVPEITRLGGRPNRIEGHTDSIGSDAYNQKLSEARALTVRDWLAKRNVIPASTPIRGYGNRCRSRRTRRRTARTIRKAASATAASRWCSKAARSGG